MYQALFYSREQGKQGLYSHGVYILVEDTESKQTTAANQLVMEPYDISTMLIKLVNFHVHYLNYLLILK